MKLKRFIPKVSRQFTQTKDLQKAIFERNHDDIQNILKSNKNAIDYVHNYVFNDLAMYGHIETIEFVFDQLSDEHRKKILASSQILYRMLLSNTTETVIKFMQKYNKYISWVITFYNDIMWNNKGHSLLEVYIIEVCKNKKDFDKTMIKYLYLHFVKPYKYYSLLGSILLIYYKFQLEYNLELIQYVISLDNTLVLEYYHTVPNVQFALYLNNIELLQIFKKAKCNFKIDYNLLSGYIKAVPVKEEIITFLLNENVDVNILDENLQTTAHLVFAYSKDFSLPIKRQILEKTNDINIQNIDKYTVLHYILLNEKLEDYADILEKKPMDIFITNSENQYAYTLAMSKKCEDLLLKLVVKTFGKQVNEKEVLDYVFSNNISLPHSYIKKDTELNKIKLGHYEYVNTSDFQSTLIYIILYLLEILQTYTNVGIPYNPNFNTKHIVNIKTHFEDEYFEKSFYDRYSINSSKFTLSFKELSYSIICWGDENNYYISPNFGKAIQYTIEQKKEYIVIPLLLDNKKILSHANILIFDVKKKIIIHFEPHGKQYEYIGSLYKTMEEIFKQECPSFKYISPETYLPNFAYQSLSDEMNVYKRKKREASGYCTAWIFWFVELYLNNTDIDIKPLVEKSLKKIIKSKYTILEHIRNYSSFIMKKANERLIDYKVFHKYINSELFSDYITSYIYLKLNNDFKTLRTAH